MKKTRQRYFENLTGLLPPVRPGNGPVCRRRAGVPTARKRGGANLMHRIYIIRPRGGGNFTEGWYQGMEPDTRRGVTLAAVLSLLRPYDHVFIERSTGPQELEAVGKGTVLELQTIQRVETCGDCKVERLGLTVDEPTEDCIGQDTPVLVITIGEKEKETEA